jgi:hypothetical protein
MFSVCAYCGKNPPIENSHILPKWTIRFALDGSVTGKLRATDEINRRVQDAEKLPLLCSECEGIFSKRENDAAKQFKAGLITHGGMYDSGFFRFLVTILWRVGIVRTAQVKDETPGYSSALAAAVQTWGDFLRGLRSDLGDYPLWFTQLDVGLGRKVDAFMKTISRDGRGASPATNRYFANWMGCEVVVYETDGFVLVWAKTSFWLIVGVVEVPDKSNYASIQLSPGGGTFPSADHLLPPVVLATLGNQSWEYIRRSSEVSAVQRQKIQESWGQNLAKVGDSSQSQAFREDIATFGNAAWIEAPEPRSMLPNESP